MGKRGYCRSFCTHTVEVLPSRALLVRRLLPRLNFNRWVIYFKFTFPRASFVCLSFGAEGVPLLQGPSAKPSHTPNR